MYKIKLKLEYNRIITKKNDENSYSFDTHVHIGYFVGISSLRSTGHNNNNKSLHLLNISSWGKENALFYQKKRESSVVAWIWGIKWNA